MLFRSTSRLESELEVSDLDTQRRPRRRWSLMRRLVPVPGTVGSMATGIRRDLAASGTPVIGRHRYMAMLTE